MTESGRNTIADASGNLNALKHGIYAERFLSEDEKSLFYGLVDQLHRDFTFNGSSDFLQVELVAFYQIKLARSLEAGDTQAAERFDRMIRAHLSGLKATRTAREGQGQSQLETTPAEWATNLLERLRAEGVGRSEESEQCEGTAADEAVVCGAATDGTMPTGTVAAGADTDGTTNKRRTEPGT